MVLSKLMRMIREQWPWTAQRCPGQPKEAQPGSETYKRFQRRYILIRLMKEVGELAELEERGDHGPGSGAYALRSTQAAKLLISVLQFALVEGLTDDHLVDEVRQVLHSTPA